MDCGVENGRWWTEVSEKVDLITRTDGQRFLAYEGERERRKVEPAALWEVLKRLDKANFGDDEILSIHREFGPFSSYLVKDREVRQEPYRQVFVGYHSLKTGLWMLETLKMTDKQFRERVRIGDLLKESRIVVNPERRRIGIQGPDGGEFIVSSDAGDDIKSMKHDVKRVLSNEITRVLQDQHLIRVHPERFDFDVLPCGLQAFFWNHIREIAKDRKNVKLCPVCQTYFFPKKTSGVKTCSSACRQAKSRRKRR